MIYNPEMECMSREDMRRLQTERLIETVKRCYENVPFYKKKMDQKGIRPEDIKSIDDITKLPFTTKHDLRDEYPFGLQAVPMEQVVRVHASSGTTGKPVVATYTQNDLDNWAEGVARVLAVGDVGPGDVVQVSYGYGLFTGALGLHQGWERIGAAVIPASVGNTERQIMLMKDLQTTALVSTPSYALHIAEEMERLGYKKEDFKLRVGMFGSEASSEEMHAEIARKLNVLPTDNYGLSELIGPGVSGECEHKCGMHINEDHFYAEILDPEDFHALGEGEYGELVLTSLTKKSMPMIRYRTKDITKIDYSKCACGRTTARMAKLKGRTDDMLVVKGVNVFPSQIEGVLMTFKELGSSYEIIVTREDYKDKLEVRVELVDDSIVGDYGKIEKLSKDIKHALKTVLQIDVKLTIVDRMTLKRYEGKAKRVFDLRKI